MKYILFFCIASLFLQACNSNPVSQVDKLSQQNNEEVSVKNNELYEVKPIKLIPEALGKFGRSITTNSDDAQDFFNQGIQLKYAFAVNEAVSSFREAQKLDPSCAICYWGEAWALGSYLNGHMREDKATLAFSSIRKAVELAERNSNENEKALIMAMSSRYIQDYIYEERRVQDSLYALEMQKVYTAYPEDLDVATIYAEALFLLEPRRGHRAMDNPRLEKIHTVLEKVLAADIEHPGACHLYIHATESTPQPELGESCAAYLGDAIPGASHINHMPSHTYNEVGRWGESVKANLKAWHTDQKARMGRAFAIYPQHNLHMLLYAASYDGQGAIAIQAGKDFSKEWNNSMFHGLTLIRFGRFDEVLNIERPEGIVEGGIWDYCQGYALLKTGEPDFSMVYLQRVLATADTTNAYYRYFEGGPVLSVLGAILEGEIHQENSDINAAIRSFQRAVEMEDRLDYAEPEILPFSARHWLGNALLEAGQYHQAELVYREELVDHPHNGWSLFGLIESLKAQKILYDTEQDDFNSSWSRSDIWLRSSRF